MRSMESTIGDYLREHADDISDEECVGWVEAITNSVLENTKEDTEKICSAPDVVKSAALVVALYGGQHGKGNIGVARSIFNAGGRMPLDMKENPDSHLRLALAMRNPQMVKKAIEGGAELNPDVGYNKYISFGAQYKLPLGYYCRNVMSPGSVDGIDDTDKEILTLLIENGANPDADIGGGYKVLPDNLRRKRTISDIVSATYGSDHNAEGLGIITNFR